jgi:hypothetical protein
VKEGNTFLTSQTPCEITRRAHFRSLGVSFNLFFDFGWFLTKGGATSLGG